MYNTGKSLVDETNALREGLQDGKKRKRNSLRKCIRFYCFSWLLTIHRHSFHIFVSKRFRTGALQDETKSGVTGEEGANHTYRVIYYISKVIENKNYYLYFIMI